MTDFLNELWRKIYLTFIFDDRYLFFVEGLRSTLILTFVSFILGTAFAILICVMQRSNNRILKKAGVVIASALREIPTMVLLMIMVYIIFGRSSLPLMLVVSAGLTLKAGSYLSEIFNTALDTVENGEIEAARTLGMNKWQAFYYIALPQTVERAMPLYMNQFISTMQETSVVGYLAIVDLTKAASIVSSRTLDAFFGIIFITIIYFLIGLVVKMAVRLLESRKRRNEVKA
ncbi:MAG: ABC transporter permease subunit [Erysipelotrichaceae bacterium]|nr:ABC transporter permease subunit [Erysipelotrichaceae bacterium]MBP5279630.1 ABC transporter permease subunit [Erysipelotrichaceae bacterium]